MALVLLKLEAGSALDQLDIVELIEVQRTLTGAAWLSDLPPHLAKLSREARGTWARVDQLMRR